MTIHIPISLGELIDKITILKIKTTKITDPTKLKYLHYELILLENIKTQQNLNIDLTHLEQELLNINTELWHIEDAKRYHEKQQLFDQDFIQLARNVYLKNDQRARIKQEINKLVDSTIQEIKNHF